MPAVLWSIGSDPAPADESSLARWQSAVDVVRRDLDVTGYGRYQMRARFGRGWPAWVYPTLADGSYWGGRQEEGAGLLCSAAGSVSATLKEIPEIEWPVCAVDGGHPASIWDGEDPVDVLKKRPGGGAPTPGTRSPRSASSPPTSPEHFDRAPRTLGFLIARHGRRAF